jgi:hypothetical protein
MGWRSQEIIALAYIQDHIAVLRTAVGSTVIEHGSLPAMSKQI